MNNSKVINILKSRQFIIIAVLAVILISAGLVYIFYPKTSYIDEPAQIMSTFTQLEFAGDVEANETKAVYSVVNQVKVVDVKVQEGDYVEEGDILVELDKTAITYDIKEKELDVQQAKLDRDNNLTNDRAELNNLNSEISTGMNPTMLAKQSALHTAQSDYDLFVYKWNLEVNNYTQGMDKGLIEAQNALHEAQVAYCSVEKNGQASIAYQEEDVETKKKRYKRLKNELDEEGTSVTKGDVKDAKRAYEEAKVELEKVKTQAGTDLNDKAAAISNAQLLLTATDYSIRQQNNDGYILEFMKLSSALADAQADFAAAAQELQQQKSTLERKITAQSNSTSVAKAEVQLEHTKAEYDNYTIKAPCSGYVSGLTVKVGDTVDTKVLMNILNYDTMKVVVDVNEYDLDKFSLNTPVTVRINSINKTYDGTVTAIAARAEKKNDLSFVKITVSFEPDERISAGIGATVYTVEDGTESHLCVPSAAVTYNSETGESEVTVVEGSTTRQQTVVAGEENEEGYVYIEEGLEEGEIVRYTADAGGGMEAAEIMEE